MKIRFLLFTLLITNIAFAQQPAFKGIILGKNNEPVAYASIHVLNTNAGTSSDKDGTFTLSLRPGQYDLLISALGYAQRQTSIVVSETQNETITINLSESVIQLDDVVVTAEKEETDLMKVPYSISALTSKKINEFRMWNTRDIT